MKVLCPCVPGVGHIAMMVPVVQELQRAGHEVRMATGPDFCPQIESSGVAAVPAGPTRAEARAERLRRHPDSVDVAPEDQQAFHVPKVWGGIYAPAMFADLAPVVEEWRPDLLVYDVASFCGPLLAELAGIPGVSHGFGPAFPAAVLDSAEADLEPLWSAHGRTVPPGGGMRGGLHIEVWPASLQLPDGFQPEAVAPVRVSGTGRLGGPYTTEVPSSLSVLRRPVVHVTLGTVFNHNTPLFEQVIEALRDEDLSLVVTTGPDQDPSVLGPQPPSVHVERFLPHHLLLPYCDLVVSHSGAGTTLAALTHGIPSLLLPQAADGFRAAEGCVRAGAGLRLRPAEVTGHAVRSGVRELLEDPGYRQKAGKLRAEIAGMPGPSDVVRRLEAVVRG
jgi:UDP:flavonoid glycosyltransferase YjiC (YdhE family)